MADRQSTNPLYSDRNKIMSRLGYVEKQITESGDTLMQKRADLLRAATFEKLPEFHPNMIREYDALDLNDLQALFVDLRALMKNQELPLDPFNVQRSTEWYETEKPKGETMTEANIGKVIERAPEPETGYTAQEARELVSVRHPFLSFPPSGGDQFELLQGEKASEFLAIPLATQNIRSLWLDAYDPKKDDGTNLPACTSDNGIEGVPVDRKRFLDEVWSEVSDVLPPSIACESCPASQWVRAEREGEDDIPPPCSARVHAWMMIDGAEHPVRLNIPPTSIRPWRRFVGFIGGPSALPSRIIKCSIDPRSQRLNVELMETLDEETIEAMHDLRREYMPIMQAVGVNAKLHTGDPKPSGGFNMAAVRTASGKTVGELGGTTRKMLAPSKPDMTDVEPF